MTTPFSREYYSVLPYMSVNLRNETIKAVNLYLEDILKPLYRKREDRRLEVGTILHHITWLEGLRELMESYRIDEVAVVRSIREMMDRGKYIYPEDVLETILKCERLRGDCLPDKIVQGAS